MGGDVGGVRGGERQWKSNKADHGIQIAKADDVTLRSQWGCEGKGGL